MLPFSPRDTLIRDIIDTIMEDLGEKRREEKYSRYLEMMSDIRSLLISSAESARGIRLAGILAERAALSRESRRSIDFTRPA